MNGMKKHKEILSNMMEHLNIRKPILGDLKDRKASEVSGSVLNIGRTAEGSRLALG